MVRFNHVSLGYVREGDYRTGTQTAFQAQDDDKKWP